MKKTVFTLSAIIALTVLSSWAIHHSNEIKKAQWLIGTWENKTTKGSLFETWKKTSDNEFSGKSYVIQEKDTIVFETIRLAQEENGLFYIPVVKNQNEGKPVRFLAKTVTETQLVFENPEHDFPQIISYTKTGDQTLTAEISGNINGKNKKQSFHMTRVK